MQQTVKTWLARVVAVEEVEAAEAAVAAAAVVAAAAQLLPQTHCCSLCRQRGECQQTLRDLSQSANQSRWRPLGH
jgi:hypothetical protein